VVKQQAIDLSDRILTAGFPHSLIVDTTSYRIEIRKNSFTNEQIRALIGAVSSSGAAISLESGVVNIR
jgi:hypothetical protein